MTIITYLHLGSELFLSIIIARSDKYHFTVLQW